MRSVLLLLIVGLLLLGLPIVFAVEPLYSAPAGTAVAVSVPSKLGVVASRIAFASAPRAPPFAFEV